MAKNKKMANKKYGKKRNIAIVIVSIIVVVLLVLTVKNLIYQKSPDDAKKINLLQGKAVDHCKKNPRFPLKHGLKPPYAGNEVTGVGKFWVFGTLCLR